MLGKVEGKQVIDVSGVKTHKDSGKLLLVTVNASGVPGYPVTNAQALLAWANPKATVIPQEAVFPVGQSAKDYAKESNKEMSSSQSAAATAAKRFLKAHGYDVSGMKVSMHVDDIGGPSAGMMYTLGLIDKVTGEQLSGGKTIAGTGTMNAKGKVGAIGGIRLKMIGAKRDGATWFLAPGIQLLRRGRHVPQGLHVVKVARWTRRTTRWSPSAMVKAVHCRNAPSSNERAAEGDRRDTGGNRRFISKSGRFRPFVNVYVRAVLVYLTNVNQTASDNAEEFGFHAGDLVQEWLWDDDADDSIRAKIEELTGEGAGRRGL